MARKLLPPDPPTYGGDLGQGRGLLGLLLRLVLFVVGRLLWRAVSAAVPVLILTGGAAAIAWWNFPDEFAMAVGWLLEGWSAIELPSLQAAPSGGEDPIGFSSSYLSGLGELPLEVGQARNPGGATNGP